MRDYLIIFVFNSSIIYELVVAICSKFNSQKFKFQIFIGLMSISFFLNYKIFLNKSEENFNKQNYFQIYKLPRIFTREQFNTNYKKVLKENHPDVNKAKNSNDRFIYIRNIKEILLNRNRVRNYDLFGEQFEDVFEAQKSKYNYERDNFFNYAYAESTLFFIMSLIFGAIYTYDENVRSSRKFCIFFILFFFLTEIYLFSDYSKNKDVFDVFFGKYAIFQRIKFLRIFLGPLTTFFRAKSRLFEVCLSEKMIKELNVFKNFQKKFEENIDNHSEINFSESLIVLERIKSLKKKQIFNEKKIKEKIRIA